ncbi:MAG: LTA synthase family protein [Paludibacteraceae bacterium]|nr:LTA synthase family protein [Paludibacteraceae bacterium]
MAWQYNILGNVRPIDWFLVPMHGLPLDLSVAAYVTVIYGLLLCASIWIRWEIISRIADVWTAIVLMVGIWIVLGDNGCFPSWGYHIDKDIFTYLSSPREAIACAPCWQWCLAFACFMLLFLSCGWIYSKFISMDIDNLSGSWLKKFGASFAMFGMTALLFLPIRGSVTVSTINTGRVYYSTNHMLNLAAVNPLFNLMESVSENTFDAQRYRYMSAEEADRLYKSLRASQGEPSEYLLRNNRPNVVLFVLESFSLNAWEAMPQLQRIASEGVFFDNVYANSYRTDRGVTAVLGAFPGCATASVMLTPSKSQQLPQVGQVMQENEYQLKFYYGGDEDFTNMRSYLTIGGFEQRVSDHSFPLTSRLSKWGVPDHILFDYACKDILKHNTVDKHFDVILSLSSHEPFEVAYRHYDDPYLNAIAYTDSCLGAFVDSLQHSPLWDSTLLVIMADHGYPFPKGVSNYEPRRYRIPLVFAGGAISQSKVITTLGSQIDWVPTLLHQMHIDAESFSFAKDILDTTNQEYAYYHFVDGFALLTDSTTTIYDAAVDRVLSAQPVDSQALRQAQAITQIVYTVCTGRVK